MDNLILLKQKAQSIPFDIKRQKISKLKETELHKYLKKLFEAKEPTYLVEITHGTSEYGKDLVIVHSNSITNNAYAIIAKTGSIKGITAGDVDDICLKVNKILSQKNPKKLDEIISQIHQTEKHDANLKYIFDTLKINLIIVVLSGEISKNAKSRLNKEVTIPIEYYDIHRLISEFTNNYPEIFFENVPYDFLTKKITDVEIKFSIQQKKSIKNLNLSEYFIEPTLFNSEIPVKLSGDSLKPIIQNRKLPFSKLMDTLNQSNKILLIGDPGVGKSHSLAKITVDFFNKALDICMKDINNKKTIDLPLILKAKDILILENTDDLLTEYDNNLPTKKYKINILLVDGFDEISEKERDVVIDKIEKFSEKFECSVILASRKVKFPNEVLRIYKRFEILPFEVNQAIKLYERITNNKELLEILKKELKRINKNIPMMPLALLLLIELVEVTKEIPASLTELYNRYFDFSLGKEDNIEITGIEILFNYKVKKTFLSELAYNCFFAKDTLEITKDEFDAFLEKFTKERSYSLKKIKEFIMQIDRVGILNIRDTVKFCHRSFLDFFTSLYLFNNQLEIADIENNIVDFYFSDLWNDTTFFFIGLKEKLEESLINKIFNYKENDLFAHIDKFSIGRLLQAGWQTKEDVRFKAILSALDFIESISKDLNKIFSNTNDVPQIFPYFFILNIGEELFGSIFLKNSIERIDDDLRNSPDVVDLFKRILLIYSIRNLLASESYNNKVLELNQKLENKNIELSTEENIIFPALMMIVAPDNKEIRQSINRKFKRLSKKYPDLFKKILPYNKKR